MLERRLRYLMVVEELGSFTRAALALHVSQPALSQQIRQLEEAVGTQLLDRSGRRVTATDAGKLLLEHARKARTILDAGLKALQDVADLSAGSLRIGYTPTFSTYLIGPLVQSFHTDYPGISLHLHEAAQEEIEPLLIDDRLDLAIAFSQVQADDIDWLPLHEERLYLVAGKEHAHALGPGPIDARLIATSGLALLGRSFATRALIDRYFRQLSLNPKILVEVNSIAGLIEVVQHTAISTILPRVIAAAENDTLVALPLTPEPQPRRAALLHRRGAFRSAASRTFEEFLVRHVAQL